MFEVNVKTVNLANIRKTERISTVMAAPGRMVVLLQRPDLVDAIARS